MATVDYDAIVQARRDLGRVFDSFPVKWRNPSQWDRFLEALKKVPCTFLVGDTVQEWDIDTNDLIFTTFVEVFWMRSGDKK